MTSSFSSCTGLLFLDAGFLVPARVDGFFATGFFTTGFAADFLAADVATEVAVLLFVAAGLGMRLERGLVYLSENTPRQLLRSLLMILESVPVLHKNYSKYFHRIVASIRKPEKTMLSKQSSRFLDLFQYHHGMINASWITGLIRHINPQRTAGFIQQTNNANLMLPFRTRPGDFIPGWVYDGEPYTVIGRIDGMVQPDTNERIVDFVVLKFEHPDALALPPSEVWEMSLPPGAPRDDARLPFGKGGLKLSRTSNIVHLAGYIGAMKLQRPRVVPDNRPGMPEGAMRRDNGGLVILLQQVGDSNRAIPVRVYGSKVENIYDSLKRGDPIFIAEGEYRVRVKPTGEPAGTDGIEPVYKYPYIHARKIGGAFKKHIQAKPEWVNGLTAAVAPKPSPEVAEATEKAEELGLSRQALEELASS